MPIVRIDYEKEHFSENAIRKISEAIQTMAAEVTGYEPKDISVFSQSNQVTVNAAPIEIYIYATFPDSSETDMELMLQRLSPLVASFKEANGIATPFNLSVVKMNWKFKLEV